MLNNVTHKAVRIRDSKCLTFPDRVNNDPKQTALLQ